jgi:hypothetical protein
VWPAGPIGQVGWGRSWAERGGEKSGPRLLLGPERSEDFPFYFLFPFSFKTKHISKPKFELFLNFSQTHSSH